MYYRSLTFGKRFLLIASTFSLTSICVDLSVLPSGGYLMTAEFLSAPVHDLYTIESFQVLNMNEAVPSLLECITCTSVEVAEANDHSIFAVQEFGSCVAEKGQFQNKQASMERALVAQRSAPSIATRISGGGK